MQYEVHCSGVAPADGTGALRVFAVQLPFNSLPAFLNEVFDVFTLFKSRNFYVMVLLDGALLALSLFLAYYLRFDGEIPARELERFAGLVVWVVPVKVGIFLLFGLYRGMWRYTGIEDLKNLIKACVTSSGIIVVFLILTVRFEGYPRSIFPIDFGTTLLLAAGAHRHPAVFPSTQVPAGGFVFP